jgi:hypothetical protein
MILTNTLFYTLGGYSVESSTVYYLDTYLLYFYTAKKRFMGDIVRSVSLLALVSVFALLFSLAQNAYAASRTIGLEEAGVHRRSRQGSHCGVRCWSQIAS